MDDIEVREIVLVTLLNAIVLHIYRLPITKQEYERIEKIRQRLLFMYRHKRYDNIENNLVFTEAKRLYTMYLNKYLTKSTTSGIDSDNNPA